MRTRGGAYTLYREINLPGRGAVPDDRIRLSPVGGHRYELSATTYSGRWERTGFEGQLAELFEVVASVMPYVVEDWSLSKPSEKKAKPRKRNCTVKKCPRT